MSTQTGSRRRNTVLYLVGGSVAGEDAANFVANLRKPIIVDGETEVALSAVTIDYPDAIVVQAGENDVVQFRLRAAPPATYTATIAAGTYDAANLAMALQRALNNVGPANPLNSDTGSWRVVYLATGQFQIDYKRALRSQVGAADAVLTDATWDAATYGFTKTPAAAVGCCVLSAPFATNCAQVLAHVAASKSFGAALMPTGAAYVEADSIFRVAYDNPTKTFTPYVRGVAGTPVVLGADLAESLVMITKNGNDIVFSYRAWGAAQAAPMTEVLRASLLDSDGGGLDTPRFYPAFTTSETTQVVNGLQITKDPFDTVATVDVGGVLYRVDASAGTVVDLATYAAMHGEPVASAPLGDVPVNPSTGTRMSLIFPAAGSAAGLLGFAPNTSTDKGPGVSRTWLSTQPVVWSIDTTGLQSSVYITSTTLNTDSRFSSTAGGVGAPPIIGSAPSVGKYAGDNSKIEFNVPMPFYQHVATGAPQALSTVDIQIRDAAMVPLALTNSSLGQSRSTVEIRVRNHPVGI